MKLQTPKDQGRPDANREAEPSPVLGLEEGVLVSMFLWSDGKYGVTVQAHGKAMEGETLEQAADRLIRFGARKTREAEEALGREARK